MARTILVVSHTHDLHAEEVLGHLLRLGADAVLFDTGRIPRETPLTLGFASSGWDGSTKVDGRSLDLPDVGAVWWRRPQAFSLHADIMGPDDRGFALGEVHAAVTGLWSLLDAGWINDPDADERASRKLLQLETARRAGVRIPRTLVTSDPDEARRFIASLEAGAIYKAFSATESTWRETRLVDAAALEKIDAVRFAPVIFQEYIPAVADLRVTVVGDEVFPAAIRTGEKFHCDFRMAMDEMDISPCELPDGVHDALLKIMRTLRLEYGAFDLRLTPQGEAVFLEVNPAGQWLFVEHRTHQPIGLALARRLLALSETSDASPHVREPEAQLDSDVKAIPKAPRSQRRRAKG